MTFKEKYKMMKRLDNVERVATIHKYEEQHDHEKQQLLTVIQQHGVDAAKVKTY